MRTADAPKEERQEKKKEFLDKLVLHSLIEKAVQNSKLSLNVGL